MNPLQAMKKPFTAVAIFLFGFITLLHVLRLLFSWEVTINGIVIPVWLSALGAIVAGVLAVMLKRESS